MADEGIPNTEIGSIRPSLSPGILPTTTTTGVVDVVDEKDESFPKTSSSEVEAPVPVPIIFNHPKGWRLHLLTVAFVYFNHFAMKFADYLYPALCYASFPSISKCPSLALP